MPTQTKAQLLNQVEILKFQNANQIENIASLRKVNKDLQESNWRKAAQIDGLHGTINTVRSEFEAYKVGARTFQKLAEGEIMEQARENATQKLSLINSLTATVYGEAKKEAGV